MFAHLFRSFFYPIFELHFNYDKSREKTKRRNERIKRSNMEKKKKHTQSELFTHNYQLMWVILCAAFLFSFVECFIFFIFISRFFCRSRLATQRTYQHFASVLYNVVFRASLLFFVEVLFLKHICSLFWFWLCKLRYTVSSFFGTIL